MTALAWAAVCYSAALLATLALAARLTPAGWWRRANTRALAVLVLGTAAIGSLLWWMTGTLPAMAPAAPTLEPPPRAELPLPGRRYRVADALNLRAAGGVQAPRVLVLARGSIVTATGRRAGDWWQVSATVDGVAVEGWASSLWLRREQERAD